MAVSVHYRSYRSVVMDRFIALRATGRSCHLMFCSFSSFSPQIEFDELIFNLKPVLDAFSPELFFFQQGDLCIIYDAQFAAHFQLEMDNILRREHAFLFERNSKFLDILPLDLSPDEMMAWLDRLPDRLDDESHDSFAPSMAKPLSFLQEATWGKSRLARKNRVKPEALIVEDQRFTSLMLTSMLKDAFNCTVTADAASALDLYLQLAPDISFLDVELASGNGHGLAKQLRWMDRYGYLLMATVNNRLEDVELAKENQVNGFIVKPFTREKLDQHIKKFRQHRELWNGTK